jgi:hypothetical protein
MKKKKSHCLTASRPRTNATHMDREKGVDRVRERGALPGGECGGGGGGGEGPVGGVCQGWGRGERREDSVGICPYGYGTLLLW